MNILEDITLLFRISKYYYINNYSQNEIAKIENISRPQVSRLLKKARDSGIVKIDVSLPNSLDRREMASKLKNLLNLSEVIIAPSTDEEKENDAGVYSVAASYMNQVLGSYKNVGIGWGKTMYNISLQLSYKENSNELHFYPVIGNSGTNNPFLQTNSITDRFAERFRAKPYYNNALYLSLKKLFSATEKDRLAHLKSCWSNLDAVIMGIGGRITSNRIYIDELSDILDITAIKENIVGDVLGHFFLQDLSEFKIPESYEVVGIGLNELHRIPNVICVAHGSYKVDAIICTCRKGLCNVLITDEYTAKNILEQLEES